MGNSPYRKMWIYGIRKLILFLFLKKRKSENENPVVAFVHQQVERDSASGSVPVPVAAAQPAAVVSVGHASPSCGSRGEAEDRAGPPRRFSPHAFRSPCASAESCDHCADSQCLC